MQQQQHQQFQQVIPVGGVHTAAVGPNNNPAQRKNEAKGAKVIFIILFIFG
jgi:hypothetical protein